MDIPQKISVSGAPMIRKSLNRYLPGANTIKLVWYPIGVIKLADAPKHIATKNGRGSTPKISANINPIGVIITATAAFDISADKINVTKYKIDKNITGSLFSMPPNNSPTLTINSPKCLSAPVLWMAIPIGNNAAIKNMTDQFIES